jgi:hypothetical protein
MCRLFAELGRILDGWARQGVVVHLCDLPVGPFDPESPLYRHAIDLINRFNDSTRR